MCPDRTGRVGLDLRRLTRTEALFRVSRGRAHDPAVECWLQGPPAELRTIARTWFGHLRRCGDDVLERMHDGCPVACVEDAPFGYVNTYRAHVNVGFFRGADLADPAGLLQGTGKHLRHVRLAPGREPDAEALEDLIRRAYGDIRQRLAEHRDARLP